MAVLQSERLSPTLFVGLGGSGAKVVELIADKLVRHPRWDNYRDLIHFMAVDTNIGDLNERKGIPRDNRFLISDFDKRAYVRRKRGEQELDEDPKVTSWVHDWYGFRDEAGKGAGQIRIESRLSMYYNLEDDRARIVKRIGQVLDRATAADNPYRENTHKQVRCLIYGSVAGGTGSGGFLTMAYLLQSLVHEHRWGRADVSGTLFLPSIFTDKVEKALHDDIFANSYAALMELEHVMKLGYEGYRESVGFRFDPNVRNQDEVTRRPFSTAYIVDKPSELSLDRYYRAISESAYLQLFSPILTEQEGELDNYVKRQKLLASGNFSVYYGSYGCSVLVLPRKDITEYSALRYVSRVLDDYLVLGADPQFRVPYGDPKFERLQDDEKDRIVDGKFVSYVNAYAEREEQDGYEGQFCSIRGAKGPDGTLLREGFRRKLASVFDRLDEHIEIEGFDPLQVHEQNPSIAKARNNLRDDVANSSKKVLGEYLDSMLHQLRSDRFLYEFFRSNNVPPLAQRHFLIGLKGEEFVTPFEDPEDGEFLRAALENEYDLDRDGVKQDLDQAHKRLGDATQRGMVGRLLSKENKEFQSSRRKVQDWFEAAEASYRDWLKARFWEGFHEELMRQTEARLQSFRVVAERASEVSTELADKAVRFMENPAIEMGADSDASAYYMDVEVLRDDKAGVRLWDRFFEDRLDRSSLYDKDRIFAVLTEAFQPATDDEGRPVPKDAATIVREMRDRLHELGSGTLTGLIEEMDLDLSSALDLEARYHLLGDVRTAPGDPPGEVPEAGLRGYVEDKLRFFYDHAAILANVDETKLDDPTVRAAKLLYVGLAERYRGTDGNRLEAVMNRISAEAKPIDAWAEKDMAVIFRGLMGVPLYFYTRVNGELRAAYEAISALGEKRGYPLHIQSDWEQGLPILDPKFLKEAEEKRRKDDAAQEEASSRKSAIQAFSLSVMFGGVVREDGEQPGYAWSLDGVTKRLADHRDGAFREFHVLDPGLRDELVKRANSGLERRVATAPERRRFVEELQSHRGAVMRSLAMAIADEREAEKAFLNEERDVLDGLIAELG